MLPDKCQPLFSGKQHCARLNGPLSISLCSLLRLTMIHVLLALAHLHSHCHVLPFPLFQWTNFILSLLVQSLSVTRLPLSHSLYLCFLSLFLIFSLPSICRVHLFPMLLGSSTLLRSFFTHLFFSAFLHSVFFWFRSILMFSPTTAVFRAIRY